MANTYTDEVKSKLVLNILESDEQYSSLVQVADNELYLTPDNHDEEIAGKQDKLTSANAGTNVTITEESGVVKINASGSGAEYTPGTGISITNNVISVTNPTLTNTATGIASTTIRGIPATAMSALNIGASSEAAQSAVALGDSAKALGSRTITIGADAKMANNTIRGSIQLGFGTTNNSGEFNVGLGNDGSQYENYTLLKHGGKIPTERLADNGTTGQVLKKTASGMEWANESSGGATSLEDLTDVNIDTPTDKQALVYDAENDEWINSNVEATHMDSANVEYHNGEITSVKAALDKLLYITPSVTIRGGGTYEIGTEITSIKLEWDWNKEIVSQSLNQGIGSLDPALREYTVSLSPSTANITFTITGSDGTTTKSNSTSIVYQPRRYWGVSTNTTLTDAEIIALSSELSTSRTQSRTFNCSGGKYFYFVIRTDYCNNIAFKVGGLSFTDMHVETRNVVNAQGYSASYNIYRPNSLQSGNAIPVDVL